MFHSSKNKYFKKAFLPKTRDYLRPSPRNRMRHFVYRMRPDPGPGEPPKTTQLQQLWRLEPVSFNGPQQSCASHYFIHT